ncbi:hypothetical protein K3555_17790 [Leisingera sp. M527]|uniref:hypothetical protein n=1 Tax=Leisingera sp. M527 TaxID=2867014 RepID=UPI0021A88E81|nr:hypothetical protein [Leisingera sp. M527]UWQ32371.1 hypothetical protein K3555_17790 [Leisingera sp. M527]
MNFRTSSIVGAAPLIYDRFGEGIFDAGRSATFSGGASSARVGNPFTFADIEWGWSALQRSTRYRTLAGSVA